MITLYQYHPAFGLPNASPFCMKVETFLRMTDLEYENAYIDSPMKAPKGKLPYITDGDTCIADSGFILDYLFDKYQLKIDEGLSQEQRSLAHAYRVMLEERSYFAVFWTRWGIQENWEKVRPIFFGRLPFPFSLFLPERIRAQALKRIKAQGMGLHSRKEIEHLACEDTKALATQLGDKPYFLGDSPRSIDATVYAFVANLMVSEIESPIKEEALSHPQLVAYVKRMKEAYFPT